MKKILLLISFVIISFSTAFAAKGQLNAYAYGASYIYDTETQKLHVTWSQQAEASRVTIVALQGDDRYVLAEYKNVKAGLHLDSVINVWDAVAVGMPTNADLKVAIEVTTADRTSHEFIKKIDFQWPFSIDIDCNPESKYFGLMYVGQMNNSKDRGIYVFDQFVTLARSAQIDKDITLQTYWYDRTHAVPFMVRALQDGSGSLLISSADRDQETHLWLAKPQTNEGVPVYSEWTNVITSSDLKGWTGHNVAKDKFASAGLDVRENGDYWDILLYMATVNSSTTNHDAGNVYSGMYRVAKNPSGNLTGGTYYSYTAPTPNSSYSSGYKPHDVISNAYTASMLNASANWDKYGGVLYNATSENDNPNNSAFVHKTLNGNFKTDYADGDYLKRSKARTKGARFSPDFSKLAIAQGRMASELRIYDVSQANGDSHLTLSNGKSVDIVTASSGVDYDYRVFAHDIAWDYAQNVYVTVRNEGARYGIYAVATDLNGEPVTTPVQGTFNVNCPDGEFTISLSSNIDAGATLTGAGTYASCTPVTVTATPDGSHKFVRWTEGGQEVSREKSYTFYATRDRELVAEFAYAVYNVEWYGLFQNHEDISDPSLDTERNARLWRLFQVEYNKHAGTSQTDMGEATNTKSGSTRYMYYVLKFVNTNFGSYDTPSERCALIESFLDDDSNPSNFYWLGQYIESVVGRDDINKYFDGTYTTNIWGFYLQSFINRTRKSHNQSFETATDVGKAINGDYKVVDFSEASKPERWRSYWTEHACKLPKTYSYEKGLPKDWNWYELPVGWSIADAANSKTIYNPCDTWCKWNNQAANPNKLLAWYYDDKNNPTWPANPTIVRNVYKDGALFATWVDKSISEDENKQQKNSDVIYLLNQHNGTHNIEVDRTLQANMYNTFCLPFGVNAKSQLPSELQNATFVKFVGVENLYETSGDEVAVLNFSEVTFSEADTLEAGKPYLVLPKTDISTSKVYTNIKTDYKNGDKNNPTVVERAKTVTQETANGGHVSFCGTINSVSIPEQTVILVADSRLAKTTEAGNMLGLRGYFIVDDPYIQTLADDGRLYLSMKKPVTTSVPVAPEAEQQRKPEVKKIMRNGQIYIIRDGITYTITGARVQ